MAQNRRQQNGGQHQVGIVAAKGKCDLKCSFCEHNEPLISKKYFIMNKTFNVELRQAG